MSEEKKIGRYIVESLLGEGAMGSVVKAHDPFIKRTVAIKTVKLDQSRKDSETREFIDRFFREAQISGQLTHPNIVATYDVGEQDGMPYIAMEYVEGTTFNKFFNQIPRPGYADLLRLLSQIADALDYAHGKGVVHRDLKPGNIMVMAGGTAKIMDFGIAKMVDSNLTQTGMFLGTPSYSSPEQVKEGLVDYRSDLFSFGILAHEALTGYLPFPGQSINAILYKVANEPPTFSPNLPDLPVDQDQWRRIFNKILNKSPKLRYVDAKSFVVSLSEAIDIPLEEKEAAAPHLEETIATLSRDLDLAEPTPDLGKNLRRSEYERSQAFNDETVVKPARVKPKPRPKKKKSMLVPSIILLLLAAGGIAAWQLGYLDEGLVWAQAQLNGGEESVTVVDDPKPEVSAVAKSFLIDSSPQGANVTIAGASAGQTPLNYDWTGAPGDSLSIQVDKDGYKAGERTLAFGESLDDRYLFELELAAVERRISTTPAGAKVLIDGQSSGTTPVQTAFVPDQTYKIRAEKNGYFAKQITYQEGKTDPAALSFVLNPVPPPGTLAVESEMEDLRITVSGKTYRDRKIVVPPGKYSVRLRSSRYYYDETRTNVEITSNQTETLPTPVIINIPKVDFIGGFVHVRINGKFVEREGEKDTTPLVDLSLPAGRYNFEFLHPNGDLAAKKDFEVTRSEPIIVAPDSNPDN